MLQAVAKFTEAMVEEDIPGAKESRPLGVAKVTASWLSELPNGGKQILRDIVSLLILPAASNCSGNIFKTRLTHISGGRVTHCWTVDNGFLVHLPSRPLAWMANLLKSCLVKSN